MSTQASSTMADSDAEQLTMLRESAMDVVQRGANMKHLRERRGTLPGYDPAYLRQMAELGWLGLLVPEAHGGLGLGLTEMAALLQELGKGLMADPLPAVALATRVLVHCPQWAAAGGHLAALARGEALPAVAWQEGLGGIDPAAISTAAKPEGTGWRLSGRKRFVVGAAGAAGFIVSARNADACGLFWISKDAPGLSLEHEWRADQTPIGVLALDLSLIHI